MLWTRAVSPPPVAPATPEGRAAAAYLGLAVGDALGATVEFLTPREIQHRHGTHRDIVGGGWLHLKTALVTFLIVYHLYCGRLMRAFAEGRNTRSHVWFRFFNEIPVLVLIACVFLVVLKPF